MPHGTGDMSGGHPLWQRKPHRFQRRMFWKLHVAFVIIALLSGLCAATSSHVIAPPQSVPEPIIPLAGLLAEKIDSAVAMRETNSVGSVVGQGAPNNLDDSVDDVAKQFRLRVTLWDANLAVLGESEPGMNPPKLSGPSCQWLRFQRGPAMAVQLEDGRWLGIGYRWHWDPLRAALGLMIAGGVSALLLYPLARRMSGRLERLQSAVDRWGNGDLAARADVRGHDEIAELAARFNQSAERVQQLLDSQRRMLASASHELRSPLARVRMAVELLDNGTAENAKLLADTTQDIEELDALVGDLLLASRLQSGAPATAFGPVDIGEIAREEAGRSGAVATGDAVVSGDAKMLRRAIRNLLENARRYGQNTLVEISVGRVPNVAGDRVEIVVRDRGPGVPAGEAQRIFEPFYRPAGHAEGRDGGVGLGLALVHEIAVHHGGQIRYEAREGGGSRFVLSLPVP